MNPELFPSLYGCGNLLAITTNQDLNRMACRRWSELLDGSELFRWEKSGYETPENQHLLVGKAIWGDLSLHRWMQPDCDSPPLHERNPEKNGTLDNERILLTLRDKSILPAGAGEQQNDNDLWLVYDPPPEYHNCSLPLEPYNVTYSEQTVLRELYREMLNHLKSQLVNLDPEATLADIWKREEEYTSLLGHGISMPHFWSPDITRSILMVTRPKSPVVCPLTQRPIEIVFLLLSPTGNPKAHLEHLSYIARLIGSQSRRQRMLQAKNSAELYDLIVSD
jgi:mannitol/fructose-specific phosphotransferase system IIA component (Ntr-type)